MATTETTLPRRAPQATPLPDRFPPFLQRGERNDARFGSGAEPRVQGHSEEDGMGLPALRDFTFTSVTVDADGRIVDRPAGSGLYYPEDLGSLDLDMVAITGGTFLMGSPEDEVGRSPSEGP